MKSSLASSKQRVRNVEIDYPPSKRENKTEARKAAVETHPSQTQQFS
jgi:hypothetical protein